MNAAVKVLSRGRLVAHAQPKAVSLKHNWPVMLLAIVALISALSVVYVKDLSRRMFIEYQTLEDTQSELNADWSKLLLEQSAWSTHARVQTIAEQRLNMEIPMPGHVVMLRE
ncbi:MAG: cell division protein FtsL [Gammaproteobacteria bacterium]